MPPRDGGRFDEQQPGHHPLHVLQLDVERLVQQHRPLDPFGAQVQVADVAVVGEIDFGQGGAGRFHCVRLSPLGDQALRQGAARQQSAPALARRATRCRGSPGPAPPAECRATAPPPARCGAARPVRCGPAAGRLRAAAAVRYSHCGGMSGASVSSTSADSGSAAASRRICCARSKVTVPPKPSLKPSRTNSSRLLRAAVEGVGDAGHPGPAQVLEQRVGGAAHVQDHRQCHAGAPAPAAPRQERSCRAAVRARAAKKSRPISPTATSRGSSRGLRQRLVQALQVVRLRRAGAQRMDAQRIAVAMAVRQFAHGLEVADLDRGQHAMVDAGFARAGAHGVAVRGEFRRVQVAVCINPRGSWHHDAASRAGPRKP